MKSKIAIYSDSLLSRGGGAHVVRELAKSLNADIVTCEVDQNFRDSLPSNITIITTGSFFKNVSIPFFSLFESPLRFYFMKDKKYDLNIFVGNYSIFASRNTKNNIWLCFTPNRIMYDLKEWKLKTSPLLNRIFLFFHTVLFQKMDNYIVKKYMKIIIAQNRNIKDRIFKYYQKKSIVIHSPVCTKNYSFKKFGDFYFTVSRLVPEKRVQLIAEAFSLMPNKKLIIVGNGTEKKKIKSIIEGKNNIQLFDNIDDNGVRKLYSECLATIYMPIYEDFGLVPIESMASGKLCIAANEGGCKETIENMKSGILINPTVSDIIKTVNTLTKKDVLSMKGNCIKRAKLFDIDLFEKKWKIVTQHLLKS